MKMSQFTPDMIKNRTYEHFFNKGTSLYSLGDVTEFEYIEADNAFKAIITSKIDYSVRIECDNKFPIKSVCNCGQYYYHCEHAVAVLLKISHEWEKYEKKITKLRMTSETMPFVDYFKNLSSKSTVTPSSQQYSCELIPVFCIDSKGEQKCWLEFKLLTPKVYKLRNISDFMNAFKYNRVYELSSKIDLNLSNCFEDSISNALLKLLEAAFNDEKDIQRWDYSQSVFSSFKKAKKFFLTKSRMMQFFEIMNNTPFEIQYNSQSATLGTVVYKRPAFDLSVLSVEGGISLSFNDGSENKKYFPLDDSNSYLYYDGYIYNVDHEFSRYIEPIITYQQKYNTNILSLPQTEVANVFSTILPKFEKIGTIKVSESIAKNYVRLPLDIKIYFDKFQKGIAAKIEFCYDELVINPLSSPTTQKTTDNKVVVRNKDEENAILELFRDAGFKKSSDFLVLIDEEAMYSFLRDYLPDLKEKSEIFYSEDFKNIRLVSSGTFKAGVKLNKEGSLLEMKIDYEGFEPTDLKEILAAYKIKKKYHRLKSGTFISLETEELKILSDLCDQLSISSDQLSKKTIELPKYRALYLDSLAKEKSDFRIDRAAGFKKMVQDIREPSDLELEVPTDIQGELREYQKIGFKWLKSLSNYGLGGILADDMGLGKTLQVIAFVLHEKANGAKASLVIAPTSLVYNWEAEVQKFAPQLKVSIIIGAASERQKTIESINDSDLIITSYGMVKRDIDIYTKKQFKYCFIDEAQHIKNPNTLNAKSVKKIKAEGYFALTGTPIENSLTELWSIFDFLMPAYLQTHSKFVNRFEIPIVKNKDVKAMDTLRRHIQPFILRRMKKDVLKELPPKIESKMTNDMTDEQHKLYIAYLQEAKKVIETEIKANGFEKSQIKILSILTRLRQICCHPGMFIENYAGGSGKLEILKELLEDIIDSGHRVLIFSQFTSMLAIIKTELESSGITYHYLDGSTPSEERMRLVNSFNAGEDKVFLLSLKAGGTGLNLTGADVVIHFDPWWNPAVEDQASDRAYRIGQKNSVSVYKLITKNTIEEKIFELQLRKKELIDSVIKPGENFLTKMSQDEIKSLFDFAEE